MKAVIQRVTEASVSVDGEEVSRIGTGFLILLGVETGDTEKDADWLIEKCTGLRIYEDEQGKMNRGLSDVGGEILAVSQFTLLGDCKHGRRPSFTRAEKPEEADALYRYFVEGCRSKGIPTQTGRFRTHMRVSLVNDGPVTMLLDTREGKHE